LPELLDLIAWGHAENLRGALVTLVAVEGGSARAPGAQMAVLEDGRFAGYLSGGCLETIIASEAVRLMAAGRDDVLRFGAGSPFVDVRLPCGGSIDLHVHIDPDPVLLAAARARLSTRQPFAIDFLPEFGRAALVDTAAPLRSGWHEQRFRRVYLPQTRLLLVGRGLEFETLARLGGAIGNEVIALAADDDGAERLAAAGLNSTRLLSPDAIDELPIDPWTAIVLLFHDHDWEHPILRAALRAEPFYIGALGSAETHRRRCERLLADGLDIADVERIRGPVGLFGPTRDAVSLALSVLAELAQLRMKVDQS
jgi:xanthine dehydrogenase accessory factor